MTAYGWGAAAWGSVAWAQAAPLVAPEGPIPSTWIYATPTETLRSAAVNQFLEIHGVTVVGQGSPVVTISGGLTTWQTLGVGNSGVAQSFVAPANIGWIRLPLTSTDLAPTTEAGWATAAPITVGIYTDNAGVPGTLVASTTVPAEQIEAAQQTTWPEPADLLFGVAASDAQASLPQLPGAGWAGMTSLVAGAWAVLFATQSTNPTQMWVAPFDGSDLGGWITGSALPVSGIDQVVYAPTAQVIVALSGGSLWAATFSQNGGAGSWQALPVLAGLGSGLIGVLTYEGADYLVAVAANGATSYASLSLSASIGAWTAGPVFPVSFSSGGGYQVGAGLVMITHAGSIATLVTLSAPGGGWVVSGSIAATASSVLGVVGNTVVTTNGSTIDATALSATGLSPWSLPVPLSAAGSSVVMFSFSLGSQYAVFWVPTSLGVTGWSQVAYTSAWASVPLPTPLTAGATYHLVLAGANNPTVGVALPLVVSSESKAQIYIGGQWKTIGVLMTRYGWGAKAWGNMAWAQNMLQSTQSSGSIPFLALYGSGAPLALIATGKTTVLWFDPPSGVLASVVELVDSTSVSRAVTYAGGVVSEVN